MNYVEKFQAGGQADQDQQLNVLAQAMVQLQLLGLAAEAGDSNAQAIMQEIQKRAQAMVQQAQQPAMAKCGAKLKKKEEGGLVDSAKCGKRLKKAACGKKLELGGKPCNCKPHLKRVGGKLVNVDCNGKIVK